MAKLNAEEYKLFEDIKIVRTDGGEYWPVPELTPILGYAKWDNLSKVIDRAMLASKNNGFSLADHFPDVGKMVDIGSGTKRKVIVYELSLYLCQALHKTGKDSFSCDV